MQQIAGRGMSVSMQPAVCATAHAVRRNAIMGVRNLHAVLVGLAGAFLPAELCNAQESFFSAIAEAARAAITPSTVLGSRTNYLDRIILDVDNDSFSVTNTDRDYTNGLRLSVQRTPKKRSATQHPDVESMSTYGFHIGQNMYTPGDITLPPARIPPTDHPYGAWLYVGVYKEQTLTTGESWRNELNIGCIGPCAHGKEVQTEWHKIVGARVPRGWDAQVHNELGVLARMEYSPTIFSTAPTVWEFIPTFSVDLGNVHLRAAVEGYARVGTIVPSSCGGRPARGIGPFALPDPEIGANRPCAGISATRSQFFGYLRGEAKLVGYNALLQGPMFNGGSPHTVDPERLVVDMEFGVGLQHGRLTAQAGLVTRSTEVAQQSWDLWKHRFLRLQVGLAW